MGHATLSPSARYRWSACPASVKASLPYQVEGGRSSASAIDGTHSHTLLEYCLKAKDGIADASRFIGTMLFDHEGNFAVDSERAARVQVAVDYIRSRSKDALIISEAKVDPKSLVGRGDMSGTVDVQIHSRDELEIIDYKDGMNHVSAEGNLQLEQYAIGVLAELLNMKRDDKHYVLPQNIRMTIIQPKVALKGSPAITSHVVPIDELFINVLPAMTRQAEATDAPNAPFIPGEPQCNYCPARGNCSASANHALEKAGIKFADLDLAKKAAESAEPSQLSDEQLKELIEAAPLLRKMIEAAEEEALTRIKAGHVIPGLKAVEGRGSRKWAQSEEETASKLTKMGVPKGEVWRSVLISPAQLEKLVWEKRDGTTKQLSPRQLGVISSQLIIKTAGALTVVPEADRRDGVKFTDVKELFQAVPQQDATPDWLS